MMQIKTNLYQRELIRRKTRK